MQSIEKYQIVLALNWKVWKRGEFELGADLDDNDDEVHEPPSKKKFGDLFDAEELAAMKEEVKEQFKAEYRAQLLSKLKFVLINICFSTSFYNQYKL